MELLVILKKMFLILIFGVQSVQFCYDQNVQSLFSDGYGNLDK